MGAHPQVQVKGESAKEEKVTDDGEPEQETIAVESWGAGYVLRVACCVFLGHYRCMLRG